MSAHIFCSIWPINRTLSDSTTPGQTGPGSNDNKRVLLVPQISKDVASSEKDLMSNPGTRWWGSYPCAEMQSVNSIAEAGRVEMNFEIMAMKEYSTHPRSPEQEFHRKMQFSLLSSIYISEPTACDTTSIFQVPQIELYALGRNFFHLLPILLTYLFSKLFFLVWYKARNIGHPVIIKLTCCALKYEVYLCQM